MSEPRQSDIGPFAIVPAWVIDAAPSCVTVYALLALHADRHSDECWPSLRSMGERLGASTDTVRRRVRELQTVGAITVTERQRGDGSQASNLYTVHQVPPTPGTAATGAPSSAARAASQQREALNQNQEPEPSEPQNTDTAAAALPLPLPPPEPAPAKPDKLAGFDEFWQAYPRKIAKGNARKAWPRAVKAAGSPEVLRQAADAFAVHVKAEGTAPQYVPHAASWLNAERWADEPGAPPRQRGPRRPPPTRPIDDDREAPEGRVYLGGRP